MEEEIPEPKKLYHENRRIKKTKKKKKKKEMCDRNFQCYIKLENTFCLLFTHPNGIERYDKKCQGPLH